MKILTVLGTRPEIIRLSRIIAKLDGLCTQVLVHTGQNHDPCLNAVFLRELSVRAPDYQLEARGGFAEQVGVVFARMEALLRAEAPDKFLVLGDTNSSLAAIVAKRMSIPVYHMEAGNRCYDDRVPEEVNRRLIDHASDVLMPYTERGRQNLLREGVAGERIYVTGNPIYEVIRHHEEQIKESRILPELGLDRGRYFLATMHRQENVDVEARLRSVVAALEMLHREYRLPIIVSTHPRTRRRLREFGLKAAGEGVRFLEPMGFFAFITLERNASCVLSDSGTVQEECSILRVPSVTIRDVTERPETMECGSNILAGSEPAQIALAVRVAREAAVTWEVPRGYLVENVSDVVTRLLIGYRQGADKGGTRPAGSSGDNRGANPLAP